MLKSQNSQKLGLAALAQGGYLEALTFISAALGILVTECKPSQETNPSADMIHILISIWTAPDINLENLYA